MRVHLLFLGFAIVACGDTAVKSPGPGAPEDPVQAPAPAAPPPIALENGEALFMVKQRSRRAIPGSDGAIYVTLDDITAGQVRLGVETREGDELLAPKLRAARDSATFTVEGHTYTVSIEGFDLHMLHDDNARIKVTGEAHAGPQEKQGSKTLSQEERIEALIRVVADSGVTFIRNGTEHNAAEAADHLRTKRERAGDRIRTAEDFIEHLATKSSMSGEPYMIRLPDGRQLPSGQYLAEELARIDGK